ncbi:MAG: type II toxin-antitoxin system Phd/YefM family antitoxin [Ginsengibacter sp.]
MKVLNYSDLRLNLKSSLDSVLDDDTPIIVKRPKGKGGIVLVSEESFRSIIETAHLLSTNANRKHLTKGMLQARSKKLTTIDINNLWK